MRSDAVELLAAVGCRRALRGAWQLRARGGRADAAERLEAVAARVDASGVGPLEGDALPMALQLGPGWSWGSGSGFGLGFGLGVGLRLGLGFGLGLRRAQLARAQLLLLVEGLPLLLVRQQHLG